MVFRWIVGVALPPNWFAAAKYMLLGGGMSLLECGWAFYDACSGMVNIESENG